MSILSLVSLAVSILGVVIYSVLLSGSGSAWLFILLSIASVALPPIAKKVRISRGKKGTVFEIIALVVGGFNFYCIFFALTDLPLLIGYLGWVISGVAYKMVKKNKKSGSNQSDDLFGKMFAEMRAKGLVVNEKYINSDLSSTTLGTSVNTPFFFASPPHQTGANLSLHLETREGQPLSFKRIGSTDPGPGGHDGGPCDIYEAYTGSGELYGKLIVNDYCSKTTEAPPVGFRFSPNSQYAPFNKNASDENNNEEDKNTSTKKETETSLDAVSISCYVADSSRGAFVKAEKDPEPIIPKEGGTEVPQPEIRFCRKCQAKLIPNSRFCNQCGADVAEGQVLPKCTKCGSVIPDDSKFCPFCGKKMT